jgi:hypothetical protein
MSEADKPNNDSTGAKTPHEQGVEQNHSPSPRQPIITERQKEQARQFLEKWAKRPAQRLIKYLDDHSGALTAAATVAIAWLTTSLSHDSAKQAESANGQLSVMKQQIEATIIQLRPYIGETEVQYTAIAAPQEKGKPPVFIGAVINTSWKNFGSTPAKGLEAWSSAKAFPNGSEPDFLKPFNRVDISTADIGPGIIFSNAGMTVPKADVDATNAGHERFFVWGQAIYRDPFPNSPLHSSRFCFISSNPLPTEAGAPISFRVYKPECNQSN